MINIRECLEKDLPEIIRLEPLCFKSPFQEKDVHYEFYENPVSKILVACDENDHLLGFLDYWHTFDSATICQIAVNPQFRRLHIADLLMKDMIQDCFAERVMYITLEVRESNIPAISLYLKHNFQKVTIKPHYYSDNENAIYMVRKETL